ncbi:hypothetical protein [Vibrio scophthalmi]|uniref:Uncharacterized protein n=1 Tax=Vibrio scophthalmi TaxID=45658 RepID=A0A1E3WMJ1_9VIBR|nr:hypothetical protein [Vibrio scophthalmi]ODS10955.1 hypothetical protein VSF3289_01216 [Vibrio scophthalmi]
MNNTKEQKVFSLVRKLRQSGCQPQSPKKTPRGALINILHPTPDMTKGATEIKQCLNGVSTLVYVLNLDGCTVSWQGVTTCQIH